MERLSTSWIGINVELSHDRTSDFAYLWHVSHVHVTCRVSQELHWLYDLHDVSYQETFHAGHPQIVLRRSSWSPCVSLQNHQGWIIQTVPWRRAIWLLPASTWLGSLSRAAKLLFRLLVQGDCYGPSTVFSYRAIRLHEGCKCIHSNYPTRTGIWQPMKVIQKAQERLFLASKYKPANIITLGYKRVRHSS